MFLKELRESKGITQTKLADELKIKQNTYNGYEIGRTQPSIETLIKIADYFEVSIDHLVGRQFAKMLYLDNLTNEQQEVVKMVSHMNEIQVAKVNVYIQALLGQISF